MARSRKKVAFVPAWGNENPYLDNLAAALGSSGVEVQITDYPDGPLPLTTIARAMPGVGVIHLHWISPLVERMFWRTSPVKKMLKYILLKFLLILDIWLARAKGVKIVWTVHNLIEHDSPDERIELKLRRDIGRAVDVLCFHSLEAKELVFEQYGLPANTSSYVVPHACYGSHYGIPQSRGAESERAEETSFVYLFFGMIRRYKGVSQLIESFSSLEDDSVRLIIAGKVMDQDDLPWLTEAAEKDRRIVFRNGFVPNDELAGLVSLADVVVLPFSKTLSSGSALLAITFGKPLILPENARVFGVPGDEGALYFGKGAGLSQTMALARKTDLAPFAEHNRKLAKKLTWDAMAEELTLVYGE